MRIHDYIDYWARRMPAHPFATDGTRTVTWAEFQAWSLQVAQWLSAELEPGARLGLVAKNSLDVLAVYFGASRAGVIPVPMNTRLAPAEWSFILRDAGAELVVAEAEFVPALHGIGEGVVQHWVAIGGGGPGWRSFDEEVGVQPASPVARSVSPEMPLYQMYTSGTTGSPKGAILTQRGVTANIGQLHTALDVYRTTAMVAMPLFHAGGAVSAFTNAAGGTTSRIVRDFDPGEVLRILREERVAMTTLVPAMIQILLQHPSVRDSGYPDLRLIAYGASPIASDVLREAIDVFGCSFVQAYGMTELSSTVTLLDPEDHVRALAEAPNLLLSAGRPLVGIELRIVDDDDHEVAAGVVGEVLVRGPQMMVGYHDRPDATAEALRDGWMHTGDAGHLDEDGYLYISDRVKDMIVSGGENVYPREIEEALFKLDGVIDAAAIGIPDDRWGEVAKAIVVAAPGVELSHDAVIAHCRSLLAGFKCPRSVDFVDQLPRNATGKVLKRELRQPYWQGYERGVH